VRVLGGGVDQTLDLSGTDDDLNLKQWNVFNITVDASGNASIAFIQTMEGTTCGTIPVEFERVSTQSVETDELAVSATTEVAARINDEGNVRVDWLPEDMEAEVRMVADDPDEEFPDELTDGDLGCEGTGHCVIENPEAGAILYLTVFPAGVDALDPVEDVTSVRIEVPASTSADDPPAGSGDEGSTGEVKEENPPATESETPPDGLPPEDPPEPEDEPEGETPPE
jgi:hypothetical protein